VLAAAVLGATAVSSTEASQGSPGNPSHLLFTQAYPPARPPACLRCRYGPPHRDLLGANFRRTLILQQRNKIFTIIRTSQVLLMAFVVSTIFWREVGGRAGVGWAGGLGGCKRVGRVCWGFAVLALRSAGGCSARLATRRVCPVSKCLPPPAASGQEQCRGWQPVHGSPLL
jgi:hypothetical protein